MRSCTAKLEIRSVLAQADRIAKLRDSGLSCEVLARRFGVSPGTIYRALKQAREKQTCDGCHRQSWRA